MACADVRAVTATVDDQSGDCNEGSRWHDWFSMSMHKCVWGALPANWNLGLAW